MDSLPQAKINLFVIAESQRLRPYLQGLNTNHPQVGYELSGHKFLGDKLDPNLSQEEEAIDRIQLVSMVQFLGFHP